MMYYIDKFERVVDKLRYTGNYTAVLITGTQYTIVSDVDTHLSVGDYLTLGLVKVRVLTVVDNKNFTVDSIDTVVVSSGIWKALAPYSIYGTRKTINIKLKAKNGGEYAYQKYPLIALRLPAPIDYAGDVAKLQANVLIATFTNKTQEPHERIANTFKPILYPLMNRFLEMCKRTGEFMMFTSDHEQIDRMFYGTESGDEQNIASVFDDPLDAVELRNLELRFMDEDCTDPPNFDSSTVITLTVTDEGFEYVFESVFES